MIEAAFFFARSFNSINFFISTMDIELYILYREMISRIFINNP